MTKIDINTTFWALLILTNVTTGWISLMYLFGALVYLILGFKAVHDNIK